MKSAFLTSKPTIINQLTITIFLLGMVLFSLYNLLSCRTIMYCFPIELYIYICLYIYFGLDSFLVDVDGELREETSRTLDTSCPSHDSLGGDGVLKTFRNIK